MRGTRTEATALATLLIDIRACHACDADLPLGPRPVLRASETARLLIVGQAPGTRVHETGIPWNDRSGERLRSWLKMTPETFYDETRIAIVPMGFCYPGVNAKGGDLPPRPECAPLWHARIRALLPDIRLTLLVGQYAQAWYLGTRRSKTLTETVRRSAEFLKDGLVPLPHPSWRTTAWERKNPWFTDELLPNLRAELAALGL